jgi:very-short-patch-repair endonuclease
MIRKDKIEKNCLFCEKTFLVYPSQIGKKFCSKKCVDLHKSNGLTTTCERCEKVFNVSPSDKKTARFCSKKCQIPERIKKICQTCGEIYFVRPCHSDSKFCNRNCKRHTKETKSLIKEKRKTQIITPNQIDALSKNRTWRKGQTKETNPKIAAQAKKLSQMFKGRPVTQFNKHHEFLKTPEGRKQNSERMKKYYAENPEKHINRRLAEKGFETYIEKKMRLALESARISFENQFKIDKFWVDFAIPSYQIAIEVDGEYWHKDKEKDAKRDAVINSYGWLVLRFAGKRVVNEIDDCLAEIREVISSSRQ